MYAHGLCVCVNHIAVHGWLAVARNRLLEEFVYESTIKLNKFFHETV